jgi:hypothetical protein
MDETFHLTPLDVRRYDFGRAFAATIPNAWSSFASRWRRSWSV